MALKSINRLLRDTAGNFAITFAVVAFPLIGATSLAVDYANLERHRNAVQTSLDAAALATAKEFSAGVTGDALQTYAKDFFESNIPDFIDINNVDITVALSDEQITDVNGDPQTVKAVSVNASLDYNTFIAKLVGHETFTTNLLAQVALGNITVEVALVMDNSGSMSSNSKITIARNTAKELIDTVYNAASNSNKPNPVSFSLVPFASMVNVGTANASAKWMDTQGLSPIHHQNLNWWSYITPNARVWSTPAYKETVSGVQIKRSRFDVYNTLGIAWTGCVEMRPWPHNTQDTVAVLNNALPGETLATENSAEDTRERLFVPVFAPDEPDSKYAYKPSGGSTTHNNDSYSYSNNYLYDWKRKETNNSITQLHSNTHNFNGYNIAVANYNFNFGTGNNAEILANQNKRQDTMFRYQVKQWTSGGVSNYTGSSKGPNYGCTAIPMTPLTTSKTSAKAAVDLMIASGNTNIQEGLAWGWKTLSPGEPFTAGRDPADLTNRKYMIVLTDGNNTYNSSSTPNQTEYGPWGYGKHGRIDEGLTATDLAGTPYVGYNFDTFEKKMNAHTVQTCNNAKADGVTVFTIAFEVPDGSSVKQMLDACSGSGIVDNQVLATDGVFYFDVAGTELDGAMESIAAQISEMRIMR